jgi:hypothetical protein
MTVEGVLVLLGLVASYVAVCALWPYRAYPRCNGSGKKRSPSGTDLRSTPRRRLNSEHRRRKDRPMTPKLIEHGTTGGYKHCRMRPEGSCADCRKARAGVMRKRRQRPEQRSRRGGSQGSARPRTPGRVPAARRRSPPQDHSPETVMTADARGRAPPGPAPPLVRRPLNAACGSSRT